MCPTRFKVESDQGQGQRSCCVLLADKVFKECRGLLPIVSCQTTISAKSHGYTTTTFNTTHSLMLGVPYYYYYYFYTLVVLSERKGNLKRSSEKKSAVDPGRSRFQLTCVTTTTKCVSENVVGEGSWVLSNIQRERWMWLQPTPFNNRATKQS